MMGLAIAAASCGTQPAGESADATAASSSEPAVTGTATTRTTPERADRASRPRQEAPAAASTGRIRLTDTGCISFEPQWTTLRVGQSLTWSSDLKTPVTIHISGGAFDKTEFVVRPGGTITTGPARASGSFTIWSEPGACQGPPRGVQGSGPGVTVEATAGR